MGKRTKSFVAVTEKTKHSPNVIVKKTAKVTKQTKPTNTIQFTGGDRLSSSIPNTTALSSKAPYAYCKMYPGSTVELCNSGLKEKGSWDLKLVTWNVNGIRAWIKNKGLDYINEEMPDIMGIQEIKCAEKDIPAAADVAGYYSKFYSAHKPGYAGTGFYSKTQPINLAYGLGQGVHDTEGRIITAEYEKFFFVTTYVPNSGRGLIKLSYRTQDWDTALCKHIKLLDSRKPVILCGDLNVAHEEIDLANPDGNHKTAGFTNEEREGFSKLLADADMVDTFRYLYPDRKDAYSFWSSRGNSRSTNNGWRLDYFIVSRRFLPHIVDQEIRCGILGSDHCPVVTYLKF